MSDDLRHQMTREAYEALEAELHELETTARQEMAERIRTARGWGDLKENAEYHDAKDAQAHLETRILRLQDRRRNAVVVEARAQGAGRVALGSAVTVRDLDSGREQTHRLVRAQQSHPRPRRPNLEAPPPPAPPRAQGGRDGAV